MPSIEISIGSSVFIFLFFKLNSPRLGGALRGLRIAPGELVKRKDDDDDGHKLPEIIFLAVNELVFRTKKKKGSFLLGAAQTQAVGLRRFLIRKNGAKSTQAEMTPFLLLLLLCCQGIDVRVNPEKGAWEWHPEEKM